MAAIESHAHMLSQRPFPGSARPLLTIAIPHYKHRRYLEVVLDSVFSQAFDDFDILISDDRSPDDSAEIIPDRLSASGRPYQYYLQPANLGYDGNVRFCLRSARGRYVFLLGNDDALADPRTLNQIADALRQLQFPEVAFTDYEDWSTKQSGGRTTGTTILGSGVDTAMAWFRKFSFVSGLIYDHDAAIAHETAKWDQSIYYQIYLATRIIASGGQTASIHVSAVRKDVQLDGSGVPNYASKLKDAPWAFQPRHTGIDSVLRVAWDGIAPYVESGRKSQCLTQLVRHVLLTLHPYWILEYRRRANWSAGVGVARGLWPHSLLREYTILTAVDRLFLWGVYLAASSAALALPVGLIEPLKRLLKRQTGDKTT